MEQTPNWLGATIFWLYILAALFFTALVIYTIVNIPQSKENILARFDTQREQRLFTFLSILSFLVLSANMLHVLINSFNTWSRERPLDSPTTNIFSEIGTWSLSSTLFRDFAEALLYDRTRMAWTAAALSTTFAFCLYMGIEGHRRAVPNLWAFFCLAQILPISFTHNLFTLARLRLPPAVNPKIPVQILFLIGQIGMYVGFSGVTFNLAKPELLMRMVVSTRALMLLPCILAPGALYTPPALKLQPRRLVDYGVGIALLFFFGLQISAVWQDSGDVTSIWSSLFSHPAVSTLGCDFLLSIVSLLCRHMVDNERSKMKPNLEWKALQQHHKEISLQAQLKSS